MFLGQGSGNQVGHLSVFVVEPGKLGKYVSWRGKTKKAIVAACKRHYAPGTKFTFGNISYTQSWGAH